MAVVEKELNRGKVSEGTSLAENKELLAKPVISERRISTFPYIDTTPIGVLSMDQIFQIASSPLTLEERKALACARKRLRETEEGKEYQGGFDKKDLTWAGRAAKRYMSLTNRYNQSCEKVDLADRKYYYEASVEVFNKKLEPLVARRRKLRRELLTLADIFRDSKIGIVIPQEFVQDTIIKEDVHERTGLKELPKKAVESGRNLGSKILGEFSEARRNIALSVGRKIMEARQAKDKKKVALDESHVEPARQVHEERALEQDPNLANPNGKVKGFFGGISSRVNKAVEAVKEFKKSGMPLISIYYHDEVQYETKTPQIASESSINNSLVEPDKGEVIDIFKKAIAGIQSARQTENFKSGLSADLHEARESVKRYNESKAEAERRSRQTPNFREGLSSELEEVLRSINNDKIVDQRSRFFVLEAIDRWAKGGFSKEAILSRLALFKTRLPGVKETDFQTEIVVFEEDGQSTEEPKAPKVKGKQTLLKKSLLLGGGIASVGLISGLISLAVAYPDFFKQIGGSDGQEKKGTDTGISEDAKVDDSVLPPVYVAGAVSEAGAAQGAVGEPGIKRRFKIPVRDTYYTEKRVEPSQQDRQDLVIPPLSSEPTRRLSLTEIFDTEIIVKSGDSLWSIIEERVDKSGNWVNSENGITKSKVIADIVTQFLIARGQKTLLHDGYSFVLNSSEFSDPQIKIIEAAHKTKSAKEYREKVMPEFQKLMKSIKNAK